MENLKMKINENFTRDEIEELKDYLSLDELLEIITTKKLSTSTEIENLIDKILYEEMVIYRGKTSEEIVTNYLEDMENIYINNLPTIIYYNLDFEKMLIEEEKNGNIIIFSEGIITI